MSKKLILAVCSENTKWVIKKAIGEEILFSGELFRYTCPNYPDNEEELDRIIEQVKQQGSTQFGVSNITIEDEEISSILKT